MSIQELSQKEIDDVSGAFFLGSSIQFGSNLVSGFFNLVSPVGKLISLIPGVGVAHLIGDAVIQGVTDTAYRLGGGLGGNIPQTKMHFQQELSEGTYNPLGIFKYLG